METYSKTVIVTGMHRSGTSLTSSLLQKSGLNVGYSLIGADQGNKKGYYEDVDFVQFHEDVLLSQGISKEGWTLEKNVKVHEQFLGRASSIVEQKKSSQTTWGWKDPRTTLFLDFWQEQIPESVFVFLYRAPWEVVDSLYRRGDPVFERNPNFAVQIWLNYNQIILNFCNKFPEKCLLVNVYPAIEYFNSFVEIINHKFNIELSHLYNIADVYDQRMLTDRNCLSYRSGIIKQYFPDAFELYQELIAKDELSIRVLPNFMEKTKLLKFSESWVLQDWRDLRYTDKKLHKLQLEYEEKIKVEQDNNNALEIKLEKKELEYTKIQDQLEQTQDQLEQTHSQWQKTKDELESYNIQLNTQIEQQDIQLEQIQTQLENELEQKVSLLEKTKEELKIVQQEWELTLNNYEKLLSEMQEYQKVVEAMESSKFWQLRKLWFFVKRALGLTKEKFDPIDNINLT